MKSIAAYTGLLLLWLVQLLPAQTAPLVITTTSVPNGAVGQFYNVQINVTGGVQPYIFSATNNIPPGLSMSTGGILSGTPLQPGNYRLVAVVHDSAQHSASQIYQISIGQVPLTVPVTTLPTATIGVPYSTTVNASGGTPPYTYSSQGNVGLSIQSNGQITGTVPAGTAPGTYPIDVTVTDNAGASYATVLQLPVVASLRFLTTSPLPPAFEGSAYSTSFQATGGTGTYTYSATGLPAYLTLSPQGVLSGTPPSGAAANVPITVTVTSGNVSASANFIVPVQPPQISFQTTALPNGMETVPYSATLQAGGGTGPYTFTATGAPSWLMVSSAGVLSGTPPIGSAGATNIAFTATDARGATKTAVLTLLITAVHGNLTISSPTPLPGATVGVPYAFALSAIGGAGPYTWSGTGLPSGLNITSRTGLLVGTPTAPGDYFITVQATDKNQNVAFAALELVVSPGQVTILTTSPLATGQLMTAYLLQFDATGADPKTWSIVGGSLPAGLTFSSDGILSGTPTSAGNSTFTVKVVDANGLTASMLFQMTVNGAGGFLVLSEGSLAFQAVANGSAPTPQNIAAISTAPNQLNFTVTSHAPWISVNPVSSITPSKITVSVDQTGLGVGTYMDTLVVTSPGQVQNIPVVLNVTALGGGLIVEPASVDLIGDVTSSLTQTLFIRNTSGAPVDFTVSADQPWINLDQLSGTVPATGTSAVTLTIPAGALPVGGYSGLIHVDSSISAITVPVSVLLSGEPQIYLETQGVLLESRSGNGVSGPKVRTFRVLTSTVNSLSYTVKQIGGAPWLTLQTPTGTTSLQQPGVLAFTTDAAALSPGAYYARFEVTSPGAVNSPQEFVVILNVMPAGASLPTPNPFPAGLVFAPKNGFPSSQPTQVFTSSDTPLSFQASTSTVTGGNWLTTDITAGTVSTYMPAVLQVTADPTGLAPGVYRGGVHLSINNLAVRTVNVTLIVPRITSAGGAFTRPADASCKPANLVVTQTGLPGNFSTPASWPRSISVRLFDDCGNVVPNGQVVAEFSNGDVPQFLRVNDAINGVYANDWVPVHPLSQITITTRAVAPGLANGTAQVTGSVTPNNAPTLAQNGTLHNLNPVVGGPLAPGTIVQIFGTNLAAAATQATMLPLPLDLDNTSVLIQGQSVPLYYVSPNQINAQLPTNLVPGRQYQILVTANGALTEPRPFNTQTVTPGVARFANGEIIAQHSDFSLVTPQNPAKPGEFLVIYLAGLGPTNQNVPDGSASPATPLATITGTPMVAVNNEPALVIFAGLTPGLVGLYQINFQVPTDAPSGSLKIEITENGASAQTSVLVVSP